MSSIAHKEVAPEPGAAGQAPDAPAHTPDAWEDQRLVPAWLAVLVLVLLLAVVGVGGYLVRGLISGNGQTMTPQQADLENWSQRVQANPNNAQAHLGLGYAYEISGQYDRALAEYATVLKLDPSSTAAYYNEGVVYSKQGRATLAEQSWWKVLALDKTQALAAKALGEYYADKRQYPSLLVAVGPAVDAHPEMADLQYLDGLANERLGHNDLAIQRYEAALKYSPDLTEARVALKRLGVTQP